MTEVQEVVRVAPGQTVVLSIAGRFDREEMHRTALLWKSMTGTNPICIRTDEMTVSALLDARRYATRRAR